MSVSAVGPTFYRVGGTIPLDTPSYVLREADERLFSSLLAGEYCYVLDSRQIGKSSLMLRTAVRLRNEGVAALILDLTALGQNVTPEQWYFGLLGQVARGLLQVGVDLEDEFDSFWDEHAELGALQRWRLALEDLVLTRWPGKIALFIDEIDCVRSLQFSTDEFFAGIREMYNRRSYNPELNRIAFCLLGVASPSDLVENPNTTPFNIGRRTELTDFTAEEAATLASGLERDESLAQRLLVRILYWTAGHPYLTQVLCRAVAEDRKISDSRDIDRHCEELFRSARAREKDDNLLFVSRQMLACPDLAGGLTLYDRIHHGRRLVLDDETDPLINHLRLAGIVRARGGALSVRNRIYREVFDERWVISRMPDAELRRQREAYKRGLIKAGAIALAVVLLILAANVTYLYLFVWEHVTYAKSWNKRYGSYEEKGPLTLEQVRHRLSSYRFVRYGRLNPIVLFQAVNSEGKLTTEHGTGTYFGDSTKSQDSDKVCQWQIVYDRDGRAVYERGLDREGRMVWGFVYSPSATTENSETPTLLNSLFGTFNSPLRNSSNRPAEAKGHYVGADGYPKADANYGAEYLQFFYDKNGFEGLILYKDRLGAPKQGIDRAFGKLNRWNAKGQNLFQISIDAAGRPMTDDSGNCGALSYYDAGGNLTFSASFDKEGNLVDWKESGYAARAYSRDQAGNNVSLSYYNADGTPGLSETGFHRADKIFDDRGHVVEYRYFGKAEEPVSLKEGYHIWRGSYDRDGNLAEFSYFDAKSLPTSSILGFHKGVSHYDQRGRQTWSAYFDAAGNKTLHKDGFHLTSTEFDDKADAHGSTKQQWRYYDMDGKPVENSSTGTHSTRSTLDTSGRTIEYAYFDRERQPVATRSGFHKTKQTFDAAGNRIERKHLDVSDRPAFSLDGISSEVAVYNENNNQISIAYYDVEGNANIAKDTGIHRIVRSFDLMGRRTQEAYFGADGKPTLNGLGVHLKTSSYDEQGNETDTRFFGTQKEPVNSIEGYHQRKNTYNKWRRLVAQACFDIGGRPAVDSASLAHRLSYQYDSCGRRVESSSYDTKERPSLGKEQYHLRRIEYDSRGNVMSTRFFGVNGEPISPVEVGFHCKKATFDEKNRQLSESYFDPHDRPSCLPRTNAHRIAYTNDELGRRVATSFFQIDGLPGSRRDGVHKFTQSYDNFGRVVKESFFDASNKPMLNADGVQTVAVRRDVQGNAVEKAAFDANGKPSNWMPDGRVHRTLLRYDGSGHAIEEAYFDTNGQPAVGANGIHRIARKFDGYGNITEISFFDKFGEPAIFFGKHRIASFYRPGELLGESYFDANGQPVVRNGISGRRKGAEKLETLDQDGNPTSPLAVITVSSVLPGGRAETAGVRIGDIILAYQDWKFPFAESADDWNRAVDALITATAAPGETLRTMTVLRDGNLQELSIAPGTLQLRLVSEASSREWLRNATGKLNNVQD